MRSLHVVLELSQNGERAPTIIATTAYGRMPAFGPFAADGGPILGIDPMLTAAAVRFRADQPGSIVSIATC